MKRMTRQLLRSAPQRILLPLCVALQGVGTWLAGLSLFAYLTYQVHSAELELAGGLSRFWQLWSQGSILAAGLPHYVMLLAVLYGGLNARETDRHYASALSRAFLAAFTIFGVLLLGLLGLFWVTAGQILRSKGEWTYHMYLESMQVFLPLLALGAAMAAGGLRKWPALMSGVSIAAAAACAAAVTAVAARHAPGLPAWTTTAPPFYPSTPLMTLLAAAVLSGTALLSRFTIKSGHGATIAVSAGAAMMWALAAGAATEHVAPFRQLTSLVWFERGDPTWWILVGCMNGLAILLAAARIYVHVNRRRSNAGQGGDAAATATAEKDSR